MSMGLDRRVRQDLLNRLRWNVLGSLDAIEILCEPYEPTSYLPFFSHPAADESLSEPSRSRIEAFSTDLARKADMDSDYSEDDEDRYKLPPNLTIDNADGRPITLRQFVTEVHAYLNRPDVMDDIKNVKATFRGHEVTREDESQGRTMIYDRPGPLPEDVEFFFARPMVLERGESIVFRISLFLDRELSVDAERFWAGRLREARRAAQERQA